MQDKKHLYEWAEQHAVEIGKDLGTSTDDALDFLRHLIDAWEEGAPPEFFSTPGDPVGNYRVVPRWIRMQLDSAENNHRCNG